MPIVCSCCATTQDYIPAASTGSVTRMQCLDLRHQALAMPLISLVSATSHLPSLFHFPYLKKVNKWYWPSLLNVLRCAEEKGKTFICSQPLQRFCNTKGMQSKGLRQEQGLPKESTDSETQKPKGWKWSEHIKKTGRWSQVKNTSRCPQIFYKFQRRFSKTS